MGVSGGMPANYDAVIFDLYGTLVDETTGSVARLGGYNRTTLEVANLIGAPPDPFVELWNSTIGQRMTGAHGSFEAYVAALCAELGVVPDAAGVTEALRLRMDFFRDRLVPRPDAVDTLAALRASGHRIGLITDCSWETPMLWPNTPFPPRFDVATFSCETGTRKPDPRIYNVTCEKLGVAPERCLYVGDGNSSELPGAEAVGMTALRIHVPYETPPDHRDPWIGPEVSSLGQVLDWVS